MGVPIRFYFKICTTDSHNSLSSGVYVTGVTRRRGVKKSSAGTFQIEIGNLIPEQSLHDEHKPLQLRGTPIMKETKFDAVCNLIYSICRK